MKHHLSAKHGIKDPQEGKKRKVEEDDSDIDVKPPLKKASSAPQLAAFLASPPKISEKITALIVEMVIDDLLPVRTVEHSGFRQLLKYLAPSYTIPCRRSITARLSAKHDELVQKAISLLGSPSVYGVGITADMWTSIATEGFIGVTAHFIDSTWEMRSIVLGSEQMQESHTASNIANRLTELANTFKVTEKVAGFIHDNASNCNAAAKELSQRHGWGRQPCVGHTIQLAVKEGLTDQTIASMLSAARRIVGHFNRSSQASTKLRDVQKHQGKKPLGLIQDCPTRWNSAHAMLERLVKLQTAVTTVLENEPGLAHLKMTGAQWDLAADLVEVLKPLQIATTVLSAEYQPSISCVFPIVYGLKTEHMASSDSDSAAVKRIKSAVRSALQARFPESERYILAWLGSALDPRFKELNFLSEENKAIVTKRLEEEVAKVTPAVDSSPEAAVREKPSEGTSIPAVDASALSFLLGQKSKPSDKQATSELEMYRNDRSSVDTGSPLPWWKGNEARFPLLAKVAKKVLAVPATSTPTERLFSTAGLICNKKRARLSAENVDTLVFLHENRKYLESV